MKIESEIAASFPDKEGFCRPDWDSISKVIETNLPESEWQSAWEMASRTWLDRIRDQLGADYQVHETENFLMLSEAPTRIVRDACRSCESSLKEILAGLKGIASDEGYGKHVVMMFSNLEHYYEYIAYFYPDGESPMSGGVCLGGEGYVHFAFPATDYSSYRTVMVHELTHECLSHLPIPAWLNEALAMRMEQLICGSDIFHLDQEVFEKHRAHWNKETIQQFWTGRSWEIPGDSFELSYNLAQVLWRKIEVDLEAQRSEISQFILKAQFADGGEEAFLKVFDLSLGDLVADFLGEGPWTPTPQRSLDEWSGRGSRMERGSFDR